MKVNELCKKNINDLKKELLNLFREQFNLRIQLITGKLKQTHFLREVRKSIARIQTLLTKKEKSKL